MRREVEGETRIRLFLFDDARARAWAPFSLTRPIGQLLFGCMSLSGRAEHAFGVHCEGHVAGPELVGFDEPGSPPAIAAEEIGTEGTRVLLSSRAALELAEVDIPAGARRLVLAGECVGWILPDGVPAPPASWLAYPASAPAAEPVLELRGTLLAWPWNLVAENADRIGRDVAALWTEGDDPAGIVRIGRGLVSLGEGVEVEPGVYVDVREGPVRLSEGVHVHGPARLVGPLFVGPGTRILGGHVAASTIGAVSVVRGEVADSVLLGYTNKAHDGYIGHALVGRWVNLGAFTTNSDLKNNYGTVAVPTPDGKRDTGLLKVGCFLGDHVKTGIGTLLGTGTVIGAGSNVFGGVMTPAFVPPFSWGVGSALGTHRLDKFFATAERAMARRGQRLTPGVRQVIERAWHATASARPTEA
jgi:UDP-N-acetylglucosamine diphosphorylase/glucosamine-1-phosphate N-acetyltransferase